MLINKFDTQKDLTSLKLRKITSRLTWFKTEFDPTGCDS